MTTPSPEPSTSGTSSTSSTSSSSLPEVPRDTSPTNALDPRLTATNPPQETPEAEGSTTADLAYRNEAPPSKAWGQVSLALIGLMVVAVAGFLVIKIVGLV